MSNVSDFNDPDGIHISETSQTDYQRTLYFNDLAYGRTYYARVTTDVWPEPGRVTSFTTKIEPYSAIIKPINNSVGLDYTYLEVTASNVTGAKRYTVELNTNSTFTGQSIIRTSLIDYQRSFIFKNLNPATRYYARVTPDVYNVPGPVRKFSTRAEIKQHRLWGIIARNNSFGGSIFSYSIDSASAKVHYYHSHPYDYLNGSLVQSGDGGFYFMSVTGGENNDGSVFKLNANGAVTNLEGTFADNGNIMQASNGDLYLSDYFINSYAGAILRINPDRPYDYWTERFPNYFDSLAGTNPKAAVIELADGYLFGTTTYSGLHGGGTIFKLRMDAGDFQKIHDFNSITGAIPSGKLLDGHNGYIYGVTSQGGTFNMGTVYRVTPDGSTYQVLHNFGNGTDGATPMGELIMIDHVLFGMTSAGGDSTQGTIFHLAADGTDYTKLFNFYEETGGTPLGGLVTDGNGALYGMTSTGGYIDVDNNYIIGTGTVFEIKTDGSGFRKLFDMGAAEIGFNDAADGTLLYLQDDWYKPHTSAARMNTDELVVDAVTLEERVEVYPNPSDHAFNIRVNAPASETVSVTMYDVRGVIVNSVQGFTNQVLQIESQSVSGLYILKIMHGHQVSMHHVVKK